MLVVYLVTDHNGLGQIKIVPCYPAVIHAVKSRIKSAGNVHNNAAGIFLDKIPHHNKKVREKLTESLAGEISI